LPNISHILLPFTAVALAVTPVGHLGRVMVWLVIADLAVALFIARVIAARRPKAEASVVVLDSKVPMHLLRRTEPALRSRRPIGVVEMQVRGRQAAEAHRRSRETSLRG
jgi:hypothetical protein